MRILFRRLFEPNHSTSVPKIWIRSYYSSFDGIRGLAVTLVFLTHLGDLVLGPKVASRLWVGVDLFFVLSGFLITGILYDSLNSPRFFLDFYKRRALRIFPIFYGFFLALLLLTPVLDLHYERSLFSFALYVGNLFTPFSDVVYHNPTTIVGTIGHISFHTTIAHFWSLCVEEQFYLAWPLLMYFVRSRTALIRICVAGCLAIPVLRIVLAALSHWWLHWWPIAFYWMPLTRVDTLLWGSLAALWLRQQPLSAEKLRKLYSALFLAPIVLMVLAGYIPSVSYTVEGMFMRTIGYTLVALASLGLVLASLDEECVIARCLRFRPLAYLGTISYGFYLYHGLLVDPFRGLASRHFIPAPWAWTIPFIAFVVTFVLAWLSFRFIESPFLRLKSRLGSQANDSVPRMRGAGHVAAFRT